MGLARDYTRATILKRRQQAARNAAADAEETERQTALRRGKAMPPPANKMQPAPDEFFEDKGAESGITFPAEPEVEVEVEESALEGVPFASEQARAVAEESGLTSADFEDVEPTGARGFTASDVRAMLPDENGEGEDDGI